MAEYETLDIAEMQKELNRVTTDKTGGGNEEYTKKFVQFPEKEGYKLLRILPRKKGEKLCAVTRLHTLSNPATGKKFSYHCPKTLENVKGKDRWVGDCIICKYYSDLWQKSESLSGKAQEAMQAQAREIKPNERYYFNVIERVEDKNGNIVDNVGPKVFSCGVKTYEKIIRAINGDVKLKEKGLGDVTHPLTGRDFKYIKKMLKTGGQEFPNYDNSKFEEVSNAGSPDDLEKWIENLWDLKSLINVKSSEELKHALRIHLGMIQDTQGQDDELAEFREASSRTVSSHTETKSESVREELVFTSQPSTEQATISTDDILADDDFMKQLEE